MRQYLVLWHRWVGLAMALFLVLAGATGAVIAFEEEIDGWLNPGLLRPAWQPGLPAMDAYRLQQKAQQQLPAGLHVDELAFRAQPGHALAFRLTSSHGQPPTVDELLVDPQTGATLGMRLRGASLLQRETLVGFIYRLHYALALPGIAGHLIMGIVALFWTLDTFVAFWLTLPRAGAKSNTGFFKRWQPAWLVKWRASATRINFDLHRAFGLWLCTVLLVFAWSSVMFNLRDQVYLPVMSKFFSFDLSWRSAPRLPAPLSAVPRPWPEAHRMARQAMQHFAQVHHLRIDFEDRLRLDRQRGLYMYSVHSSADLREDKGNTAILIDAHSGELKGWWLPTQGETGNTVSNWLGALHMGHVFGLPYRIFVCLTGLALVAISVTGVLIWSRKRASKTQLKSTGRKTVQQASA